MSSRIFGSNFWRHTSRWTGNAKLHGFGFVRSTKFPRSGLVKKTGYSLILAGVVNNYSITDANIRKFCISPILNDTLIPDARGDTFEMGLYISSQNELNSAIEKEREEFCKNCKYKIVRKIRKFIFYMHDLFEPIFTTIRFLELSLIFVPILILYPITYLGKRIYFANEITETRGALVWYCLLRKALELAGPSFIKLGQWASSRTDIFPHGFCSEFNKLHSNVKSHSSKYSKKKICESLNIDKEQFDDVFEEFHDKPLGIGAIAQVHAAKLSSNYILQKQEQENINVDDLSSKWVAIKVIHPNARKTISRDLKIMEFFANFIDSLPTMEWLSLPSEVYNFELLMNLQLDLRIEGLNLDKFNKNFKDSIQVKFPKPIEKLSNKDVLFEEYIDALPMQDFLTYRNDITDVSLRKKVSDPFINSFLQMLILDDFIHADLHPGNVMIRFVKTNRYETKIESTEQEILATIQNLKKSMKHESKETFVKNLCSVLENYTPQICFIDTGLVTELNKTNRINFIDLFNALARFDGYKAGELMIERSKTPETAINKEIFAFKVEKLVNKVKKRTFTLGTVSIGDLLDQMLGMVRSHHVRLEGDFVSVIVAILLLEGIGRRLDPNLDLFERFVSYSLIEGLI